MLSYFQNKADLVLLHAPSVYDFRKKSILYGPISDLVPSSPVFEMYPIGFSTIASYLKKHGYNVRIVNLALRMLLDPDYDVEEQIKKLNPSMFGIDLHWMPHCHGSIEIAKIVKKYHPDTPVVFGGFSSSWFRDELIKYPAVDFVVRGDTTEEPTRQLMEAVINGQSYSQIPNLTWKDNGEVHENSEMYVPDNIDHLELGYKDVVRSVVRYRDFIGTVPFVGWTKYPIMAIFTGRGCDFNCVFCGGSSHSFKNTLRRSKTVIRDPEILVKEAIGISRISRGPIFILGDIYKAGKEYAEEVLRGLSSRKIKNPLFFEFYEPPPPEFFSTVDKYLDNYCYEMSLESHDEEVRRAVGKGYSNEEIEASIKAALSHEKCHRFDLYFLIGLPKQTYEKAIDLVDYCRGLYERIDNDKRLLALVSPLAPFLDPGSRGFTDPEAHGYHLLLETLEEHRQALLKPSWKYILNYQTDWMTRDDIVRATYDSALGLNDVKKEAGVISKEKAQEIGDRIRTAKRVMKKVDEIVDKYPPEEAEKHLAELKHQVDNASISTVCEKKELEMPIGRNLLNFKIFEVLRILASKD